MTTRQPGLPRTRSAGARSSTTKWPRAKNVRSLKANRRGKRRPAADRSISTSCRVLILIGLKEQTERGAKSIAELRAKHKWNWAPDYNVVIDRRYRHTELRDKVALLYEDDEG